MKATGVVRKIDELGRIVVPKEIRRTLKMEEGTPVEMFVTETREVVLRKYSPLKNIGSYAKHFAESLHEEFGFDVMITDGNNQLAKVGDDVIYSKALVERAIQLNTIEEDNAVVVQPVSVINETVGCIVAHKEEEWTRTDMKALSFAALSLAKLV